MSQRPLLDGVIIPCPEDLEAVVALQDDPRSGVKKGDRGLRRRPWLIFVPTVPANDGLMRYRLLDVEPGTVCWTAAPVEATLP